MTIADLITTEHSQIGYQEGPNNDNKYGIWYGMNNQPWCCIFQEWSVNEAGGSSLIKKTASCGSLYSWAKTEGLLVNAPQPGDLVEFTFNGVEHAHIGLVVGMDATGKYLYTIEGNTSSGSTGSQSNGDGVYFRKRPTKQVFCYIRLKAKAEPIVQTYSIKECNVYTAPVKLSDAKKKTITTGYGVQVYYQPIPCMNGSGFFYRTIKNAFVEADKVKIC